MVFRWRSLGNSFVYTAGEHSMKKILVTGANGFIGRNIIEQLGEQYQVLPISREDVDLLDQNK